MARTLFGREADVPAVAGLLGAHRLVSIVGAGGVGKTALAETLASELRAEFGDAVFKVELVPLTHSQQLMPALVTALHASVGSAPAQEVVVNALSASPHLLVLDNCEHLLPGVAEIVCDLLASVSQLHVLATSQEALNLQDERVYRLGALALPDPEADPQEARKAGAVALFEDRANAVDQHFSLDTDNVAQVIDVCRKLDGIPLAIELAAARLRTLGVEGLRARLDDRLQLLGGGARNLPARHRTLRAAMEWSHALLSPVEQAVFRRLGVMSGGFGIEAAQYVAADDDLDEREVLDALRGLSDKSLVIAGTRPGGEVRFRLLETMRHFAIDRLAAEGEDRAIRERHLAHFLHLAESASEPLGGPEQGKWLARLDQDRDNLFAAHRTCDIATDGVERGLRLVTALIRYWFNRGALLQGQRVFEEALARPGVEQHGALYALTLMNYGRLLAFRGLDQQAAAQYSRSIDVARSCGALPVVVESMGRMGYALLGLNDRTGARAVLEEACTRARTLQGDRRAAAVAFSNLAELERLEWHFDAAAPLYEECLAINRSLGDRQATMISLNNTAMMALAQGNAAEARRRLLESFAICNELDSRRGRLVVMEVCGGMAADLEDWDRAVLFESAARRHTAEMGRRRDVVDEAFLAPRIERARKALGKKQCLAREAHADTLNYELAVGEMRAWLEAVAVDGIPGENAAQQITAREQEILSLVARGYSNSDIARLLAISVLTVRTHRQRLMDKLELRNAAEITAYAIKRGWYDPS